MHSFVSKVNGTVQNVRSLNDKYVEIEISITTSTYAPYSIDNVFTLNDAYSLNEENKIPNIMTNTVILRDYNPSDRLFYYQSLEFGEMILVIGYLRFVPNSNAQWFYVIEPVMVTSEVDDGYDLPNLSSEPSFMENTRECSSILYAQVWKFDKTSLDDFTNTCINYTVASVSSRILSGVKDPRTFYSVLDCGWKGRRSLYLSLPSPNEYGKKIYFRMYGDIDMDNKSYLEGNSQLPVLTFYVNDIELLKESVL